jgi:hypothetical protein
MKITDLKQDEYPPYSAPYIAKVGKNGLLKSMKKGKREMEDFLKNIPDELFGYAYAEGKWTLAEVILHIIDAERIFQYRALRFARRDKTPLAGFEENDYVPASNAYKRTKDSLWNEYKAVRNSSIALFKTLDVASLLAGGKANDNYISVRAIGFIISGHQQHHLTIIKERYL